MFIESIQSMTLGFVFFSLRTGEVVCCVELLGTKTSTSQITAALALLLVRFILHCFKWFLLLHFL